MLNTKKFLFLLFLAINQNCLGSELGDLSSLSESTNPEEFRAKICAALAVIKCTIYKLESILSNIDVQACCDDSGIIDNCPSLGFDDDDEECDDHESADCSEQEIDINNAATTININCDQTKKVKIVLNLNSHQS